ncbi:sugar phosphate isomerase/epimerase family protein [Pantoea sp. S-LA4]
MMEKMKLGVNSAMFDGHPPEVAFRTVRDAGFAYIELAYNQGYVGQLDPALFGRENAARINDLKQQYDLKMHALGCTINLAAPDAVEQFRLRVTFAQQIGARYLNACTARRDDRAALIDNLRRMAPIAEEAGCILCIENGGDPDYDAFALAEDGFALLEAVSHPAVAFNLDPGNMVSLCPQQDPIAEALTMLPGTRHCHLKDVMRQNGEYHFPPIGEGELNYAPLLQALAENAIPASLEIPLRMHRQPDSWPQRADQPVDPAISLEVLIRSRLALEKMLGYRLAADH